MPGHGPGRAARPGGGHGGHGQLRNCGVSPADRGRLSGVVTTAGRDEFPGAGCRKSWSRRGTPVPMHGHSRAPPVIIRHRLSGHLARRGRVRAAAVRAPAAEFATRREQLRTVSNDNTTQSADRLISRKRRTCRGSWPGADPVGRWLPGGGSSRRAVVAGRPAANSDRGRNPGPARRTGGHRRGHARPRHGTSRRSQDPPEAAAGRSRST
jgi:hypothetical protein